MFEEENGSERGFFTLLVPLDSEGKKMTKKKVVYVVGIIRLVCQSFSEAFSGSHEFRRRRFMILLSLFSFCALSCSQAFLLPLLGSNNTLEQKRALSRQAPGLEGQLSQSLSKREPT